ncbi:Inorganic phosphate transporter [Ceraceosorus bombacis]|uniref:Inorganic phosphate transporter n=1 Tax=Ceraceosorus bombacis TaxID=401625 RepID=A0A0P1BA96_9BASI|nr:Inorganic phosphate transporter [Ceraceosorus bombacis]
MTDQIEQEKGSSRSTASSASPPSFNTGSGYHAPAPGKDSAWGAAGSLDGSASSALDALLYPADCYNADKVYWASLPWAQKSAFVNEVSNKEAKRELSEIGRMFKADPLSPIRAYFSNYVITGMGLFVEGWVLFSVGNLQPLFKAVWPECFSKHQVCNKYWTSAIEPLEIAGIIIGQICVGVEGDWISRKFGMVQDAVVLTIFSIGLTAMWGTTLNGWVICWAILLFFYGFGVGGEYPVTATRAMEASSGRGAGAADRMHRGRKTALAFTMQGWGQFVNQTLLILLLLVFHHGSLEPPFSKASAQWTFRVQFAIVTVPTLWLAYHRYYKMDFTQDKRLAEAKKKAGDKSGTSGYSAASLKLAWNHYWHRIVGTAIVWLANDVAFYGSKLFSGVFIGLITGSPSNLKLTWLYSLLNIGVSLVGYYLAALVIDHRMYGRKWMQANGLAMLFIIFTVCAAAYPQLTTPGAGLKAFQAIYLLSGFFTQFGPNTTSFLLAAEVYPTMVRSTAHGVSAASGKLGAMIPAVAYSYIDSNPAKFIIVAAFSLAAWILTMVFIPDTTGLALDEQDRYWSFVLAGKAHEYHGVAVHPRHLSLYERVVLKRHLAYDAELDAQQKIHEMRRVFESTQKEGEDDLSVQQQDFLANTNGSGLQQYFLSERKLNPQPSPEQDQIVASQHRHPQHQSKLAELEGKLR